MAIKNKDGSTYSLSKPAPVMEQQSFWDKTEKIIFHNKFGEKFFRANMKVPEPTPISPKEIKIIDFKDIAKQHNDEVKIVQAIEESKKPKPISEDIVEVWCLPCLEYTENIDPLYDESYANVKYGEKFTFRAKLLELEDLHIEFVTEVDVKLQPESVIFPKMKNRRWWKIKDSKEVQGYNVYLAMISDYQPNFGG
jgi:hypothetical protein